MGWRRSKNIVFWFVIHITHWMLYFGNMVALFYIIEYQPWYVALPIVTFICNPLIGGVHCAYNNIENTYRSALGWELIEDNFLPTIMNKIKKLISRD